MMAGLFVLWIFISTGESRITRSTTFVKETNFAPDLSHHNVTSFGSLSLLQCVAMCVGTGECFSLLHDGDVQHCNILHGRPHPSNGTYLVHGTYYVNKEKVCSDDEFSYSAVMEACYLIDLSPMNYWTSQKFCSDRQAELFRVDSTEKQRFLEQTVENVPGTLHFFIDGYRDDNNMWSYSGGTPISTFYWAPNQPHGASNRKCLTVRPSKGHHLWYNWSCLQLEQTARMCLRDIYAFHPYIHPFH